LRAARECGRAVSASAGAPGMFVLCSSPLVKRVNSEGGYRRFNAAAFRARGAPSISFFFLLFQESDPPAGAPARIRLPPPPARRDHPTGRRPAGLVGREQRLPEGGTPHG
jgi:hypothetical protein